MNGAFYIGATGLRSQQRALDTVANNIANLNTTAFKRAQVRFGELVSGADLQLSGVTAIDGGRVFAQGDLKTTGRPMDLAIDGEGFIEVLGPGNEPRLWRGGGLSVSTDGFLATAEGAPLSAMIAAPLDAVSLTIAADGKVSARFGEDRPPEEIGQIELVMPARPQDLQNLGSGVYGVDETAEIMTSRPGEDGAGVLVQGALEQSNVLLADEMVQLLLMQRAFAADAQLVQAGDQLMAIANGLRR